MIRRRSTVILVALGLGLSLVATGCSAQSTEPSAQPSTATTPSEAPTTTPTAAPLVFSMPTQCADILPASRLAIFDTAELVLLGGPGGRYEGDYLLEPTPEELVGGITCIWGFSDSEASSITVSVAPLSADSRASVIDNLIAAGLNESELDGASIFGKQGNGEIAPAIINSIGATSWISVIATVGGAAPYEDAKAIIAEVSAMVYTAE